MKTKHILPGLICLPLLFSSCVGEDVVFVEELNNSVSFERKLHSVAEDETPTLHLIFRDSGNNIIDDLSDITIEYSSDNNDVLTINEVGVITPVSNGEAVITVSYTHLTLPTIYSV